MTPRRRASVLAEVLVCLGTLVPVMLIAVGLFPYAYLIGDSSDRVELARGLAESDLATARATPFDELEPASRTEHRGGTEFTVQRQVADLSPLEKRVTVEVAWTRPRPGEFEIETRVPRLQR